MSNLKSEKDILFSKYTSVIKEYFLTMNNSETIKNLANANSTLFIGLNAIHRVFEIILLKSKNIDTAYYYSKQAYFYYLEYMEQVRASELLSSLSHSDAVLFVYKKTICEVFDKDSTSQSIHNLMTINDNSLSVDDGELKIYMNDAFHYLSVFFFWNNEKISYENRYYLSQILDKHIKNFDKMKLITPYLELLQNKSEMTFSKYEDIIHELSKKLERQKLGESTKNDLLLMKFHMEPDAFHNKFYDSTTKDLVKWLIV